MHTESLLALLTVLVALASFYFPYRAGVKKDKRDQLRQAEDDRKQAIEDIVKPVKDQLEAMEADRNFWRSIVLEHNYPIPPNPAEDNDNG